ncbi:MULTISPECIES: recombinase family protein [Xanthomonas]|uniref:recombinase family protein n=1 Tax=Xanthomonas TaxID=338 RepID=UPI002B22B39F|nr:recombinase family protein [Xanthomonas campestris]MEA9759756.1 recombinase family protein [Xanthomonas campestris pv. raphani]
MIDMPVTVRRAIGYVRVSTDEQAAQGHSLALQPERIRQWCALRELQLVDIVFDEGISAGVQLHKRPGGKELMHRLRTGEADVVVVFRLDRLFRNAQHGLNFVRDELDGRGINLHSITELVDTTTPTGRLMLTMLWAVAEYERDTIRERTRSTMEGLRQQGRVYGTTPYGCVAVGGRWDESLGRVVGQHLYRDPKTWPHRELIVQLRGPHDGAEQLSLQGISTELEARGIPAPAGGRRWQKHSVSRVINTHGGLKHIQPLPTEHEPAVSEAAQP